MDIDLKDWEPVTARRILTDIEFNHVYNGRQSPFSKEEMDFLMKFVATAEQVRRSVVPQVSALFKPLQEGEKGVKLGRLDLVASGKGGRSVYTEDEFFHPND